MASLYAEMVVGDMKIVDMVADDGKKLIRVQLDRLYGRRSSESKDCERDNKDFEEDHCVWSKLVKRDGQ